MKAQLQELRQSASPQKPRSGFAPVDALTGQDEQDRAPWGLGAKTGPSPIPPGAAERSHARDDDDDEGAGEAGQRAGGARASPAFSLEAPLEAWYLPAWQLVHWLIAVFKVPPATPAVRYLPFAQFLQEEL